jgi:cardiolipin synthase
MKSLPNILTFSRIAIIPIIILMLFIPGKAAAFFALFLYIYAAVTDFFDGWLARRQQTVSAVGTFLDPIADKVLIATLLAALVALDRLDGFWIVPVLIILTREFIVSGLREYLGPKNVKVPVTMLAKWKTTFQMIALGFLIVGPYATDYALIAGQILLTVAALITLWTGWEYIKAGWPHIK